MPGFNVTYKIVTQESAQEGDAYVSRGVRPFPIRTGLDSRGSLARLDSHPLSHAVKGV